VALAHRRLAIIDTTACGAQPMQDPTGRYVLVFNGEIFNYRDLSNRFLGEAWKEMGGPRSDSDTEVLLHLLIRQGSAALLHLSGFFAFAFYDSVEGTLLIARDRFGKKPLIYHRSEADGYFAFASEMKALMEWGIPRQIAPESLLQYLQLNYVPQPSTIFKGVHKLQPGHFATLTRDGSFRTEAYWNPQQALKPAPSTLSYEDAQAALRDKLDASVQERMIADVPLGAFLSGGIDSSVVVALASRHTPHLATFSIGYADHPYFDETRYAKLVAEKFGTEHTVFSLRDADVREHIGGILDYLDEPFADSSAVPLYILCHQVRKHATVALSGDGGDEVFAGYNKHRAEARLRAGRGGMAQTLAAAALPVLERLPRSRRNKLTNIFRQAHRYAWGQSMSPRDRYWAWAGTYTERDARALLSAETRAGLDVQAYDSAKAALVECIDGGAGLEDFLRADIGMVLLSDMLVKVDMMSMANSLEVRSPFLDYKVVEFAFSLPTEYKINPALTKRIVQDAFRADLPPELYNRPKRGFEIPLLDFLRTEFRDRINNELLHPDFIRAQGIFDPARAEALRRKLFSGNPEDVSLAIWNLVVFQHWYRRYMT